MKTKEQNLNDIQNEKIDITYIINRLKSIRRFNLNTYREGDYSVETEREYNCNGDYIDSYEIDDIIGELENEL